MGFKVNHKEFSYYYVNTELISDQYNLDLCRSITFVTASDNLYCDLLEHLEF